MACFANPEFRPRRLTLGERVTVIGRHRGSIGAILAAGVVSCATVHTRPAKGGACAPESDQWMRYLRSRYEMTPHGALITDPTICRKASAALNRRDSRGRYYDVLVLPLQSGDFVVLAPALGVSRAGEFQCVVHLDARLRYKAHICG